ncbi:Anaerobic sulfatase-maturating enzyme [Dorea longicatena]|nr:Anaerobic sulfatase-maturating enzyme [Dorea longicatena]
MDQYQVDYNILTVVTPQIAAHIRTIYSFYQKKGWNYQQYIACLDPLNEPHGNNPHSLSPEVYGQFLIDLFELWYSDAVKETATIIKLPTVIKITTVKVIRCFSRKIILALWILQIKLQKTGGQISFDPLSCFLLKFYIRIIYKF